MIFTDVLKIILLTIMSKKVSETSFLNTELSELALLLFSFFLFKTRILKSRTPVFAILIFSLTLNNIDEVSLVLMFIILGCSVFDYYLESSMKHLSKISILENIDKRILLPLRVKGGLWRKTSIQFSNRKRISRVVKTVQYNDFKDYIRPIWILSITVMTSWVIWSFQWF